MSTKLEKIIEKNNLKYLRDFEVALTEEGLSDKTIRKHVENASFFVNDFLNYYEPKTIDQGILELDHFFSEWFLRKAMWASKTSYKENMTSIKKFYKFLFKSKVIDQEDYENLEQIIKENKDKWINLIDAFDAYFDDDNDDYEDSDLDYDDISYFLDSGMLDEDEANGVLNDFFKIAKAILKEKPWTYLYETDVIEITVPDEDEKLYASVIGAGGESFGIILYQGIIGLKGFFRMLSSEGENLEQINISQSYIALHFDVIHRFNPVDQAFLFGSQVSFEDDEKLPFLRVQDPGTIACPLELIELIDLENVLTLLLKTFKYLKKHKEYRDWLAQDRIFKVEATETGEINYGFKDIEAIFGEESQVGVYMDELTLKKLKKKTKKSNEVWELGQAYLPTPILEEDSDYLGHFPSLLAVLDHDTGEIRGTHMADPMSSNMEFQIYFYDMIMSLKQYPKKILFNDEEVLRSLYPILMELQIEIEFSMVLEQVTTFVNGMMSHLALFEEV